VRINGVAVSNYKTPACRFIGMPQHLLGYDRDSGEQENPQHMSCVVLGQLQHCTLANHISHLDTSGDIEYISNNPTIRLKHPGVLKGSDGSDGTSCPLMENHMLPVAHASGRVA
jgi:hypothetical protein